MKKKILLLLVEDNQAEGELIQRFLSKDSTVSYSVEHTSTLEAAKESLRSHLPDIILTDLNLPDSSGLDTVRSLEAEEFDVPIVAMTGDSNNELGLLAIQAGAQDYVAKTTENYSLLSRIIRLGLERHQTLDALKKSETRYRMLSEVSTDYMFAAHIEPDGSIVQDWTTGAIEQITGYPLDEYLAIGGWSAIVLPEDQWIDKRDKQDLFQNKTVHSEIRIRKKNGKTTWVQVKGIPVWDQENEKLLGLYGSTLDITQQKLNEIFLKESELRFKTMFAEAPMGIGLTDANTGEYINVNKYFADMVGRSIDELLTMNWMEITHPDDIDLDMGHMQQLNAGEINSFQIEKRYLHSDGSIIWVSMKVTPIKVLGSDRSFVLSMVEDITERKKQQEQLAESEKRFRLLYENAPMGITLTNSVTGKFHQVNSYFANLVGYSTEVLESMDWMQITHPDDIGTHQEEMGLLLAGKINKFQMEKQFLHADGHTVWVKIKISPMNISAGGDPLHLGMVEDITEHKRQQEQLIESENRFRLLYEHAPIAIVLANSITGNIFQANQRFADLVGFSKEHLETIDWMKITHPDDIASDTHQMDLLNAGKIDSFQMEKRFFHANGNIVWVDMHIAPMPGSITDTEEKFHLCMIQDITERKYQQQKLIESENRFRQLYEHAPLPYQSLDKDGMLLEVNDAWLKEMGYEKSETIGRYFADFLSEQDSELFPNNFKTFKKNGAVHGIEYKMLRKDHSLIDVSFDGRIVRDAKGEFVQTHCVFTNVTERNQTALAQQKNISRLESLSSILQYPYENMKDFLDFALNEAIALAESKFGYIYFYNEDTCEFELNTWSKEVMAECKVALPQTIYSLEKTGIWGEAVRQRKTILVNDFLAPNPHRKGYPEGHVPLENFLTVPIFSDEKIVAVIGVANKNSDYDHQDELQLSLLMNNVWKVVERGKALEELTELSNRMEHYVDSSPVLLSAHTLDEKENKMTWCSDNAESFLGYSRQEIIDPAWWRANQAGDHPLSLVNIGDWDQPGQDNIDQDYRFRNKAGEIVWLNEKIKLLRNADGKPIEAILAWTDITTRKQMEESVLINAARLETALSNMADAVFLTDSKGYITHFNESSAAFYKFKTKEECSVHFAEWTSVVEVMSMEEVPISPENLSIHRALRGEIQSNVEYFLRRKDTGETWFGSYNFAPVRSETGEIIGAVVTARDITEQKKLVENLRQYTQDLNKAQAVAHVGSWKWHIPTNHLTWSDEMYVIFGIDKTTFNGYLPDVVASAIHPDDRAAVEASNVSVLRDRKPVPLEYRVVHPDGTVRTVWAEAGELVLDTEGNPQELTGIVQDITERKATQAQLLLKDTALNSTANSIVITDLHGTIQWANPAFSALTGYSYDELVGNNPNQLVKSNAQNKQFYKEMWDTILAGDLWRGELINQRKDGSLYHEQMTITPITNDTDQIINFIAIKEDISLRKQHEQRIENHLKIQEKLVAMGRALGSTIDVEMIYRTAYRFISDIIDVPNMCITLLDTDDNLLDRVFAINEGIVYDLSHFSSLPYTPDNQGSYRSSAISQGKPLITNELVEKQKTDGGIFIDTIGKKPQSAVYMPMIAEGKSIGVLELQSYQKDVFTQETSEWLEVVSNQMAMAIQNTILYAQIRKRVSQLSGLREIDTSINAHQPLDSIFQLVLSQIRYHLKTDAADILLLDQETQELVFQYGYGFTESNPENVTIPIGHGLAGVAAQQGIMVQHLGPDEYSDYLNDCIKWNRENFKAYIAVPLKIGKTVRGVLEVFHRSPLNPQPEWLQYLQTLGGQTVIALENNELLWDLQQTADNLMKAYDATIEGWSQAMDLRDRETEGHTQRVTNLTQRLAKAAGIPEDQMVHFRRGALLHDIGKLGVPDHILRKPGGLDDEEWAIMKQHPQFAYDMLHQVDYLKPALDIPLYHHEKWDGSGYPQGLAGEDIPLSARIFAFVDVWDAVTNDRPYRKAWSKEKAIELIKSTTGTHFDPVLAEIFIKIVSEMDSD